MTYSSSTQLLTLHTSPPSTLSISSIVSIFALPNESGNGTSTSKQTLVAITDSQSIAVIDILLPSPSSTISFPSLSLRSLTSLPFESSTKLVLPVDPMAWSGSYTTGNRGNGHDVLLSVSEEGGLAFWIPTEGPGLVEWRCTVRVRTGKTGISIARCGSAKKSVLGMRILPISLSILLRFVSVVPGPEGEELTIWDSQESEFASGLEFQTVYK